MKRDAATKRRPGRRPDDTTRERILLAAEHLFGNKGYRNVTVREIADEAGVTHPLIYHYWGGKAGLLAAALRANQDRMRAIVTDRTGGLETVLELARQNLAGSRLYLRSLTQALADGVPPADWPGGFPATDALVEILVDAWAAGEGASREPQGGAADSEADVRATAAVTVAMVMGWVLVEEQLLEIVGLEPSDRATARETLIRCIEAVVRRVLPDETT